jgi:uncharacterized phage protein (TIGR02220 family)
MISVINHDIREKAGLNSVQYLVQDACSQFSPTLRPTGVKALSEFLGLSTTQVSDSMKELIGLQLLAKHENGFYYPTALWYNALMSDDVEVVSKAAEMTYKVISYFNVLNGTKYQPSTSLASIKSILRQKELGFDHFQSVITHKYETWGKDEKMKEYNRPATIFSSKFFKYLDDANHYWIRKAAE